MPIHPTGSCAQEDRCTIFVEQGNIYPTTSLRFNNLNHILPAEEKVQITYHLPTTYF